MKIFVASLVSELQKMRRTPALLVALLTPYLLMLFPFLFAVFEGKRFLPSSRFGSWEWLIQTTFVPWCVVVFPLVLGLLTGLVASVEHRASGWRHLFALPVDRRLLYGAKQGAVLCLVALMFFLLVLGVVVVGLVLRVWRPGLGFEAPIPFGLLGSLALGALLASAFAVAVQTWVSLVSGEVAAPVALGFVATALLLVSQTLGEAWVVSHPWAYAGEWVDRALGDGGGGQFPLAGLVGGSLFALAAAWTFSRRDVP